MLVNLLFHYIFIHRQIFHKCIENSFFGGQHVVYCMDLGEAWKQETSKKFFLTYSSSYGSILASPWSIVLHHQSSRETHCAHWSFFPKAKHCKQVSKNLLTTSSQTKLDTLNWTPQSLNRSFRKDLVIIRFQSYIVKVHMPCKLKI